MLDVPPNDDRELPHVRPDHAAGPHDAGAAAGAARGPAPAAGTHGRHVAGAGPRGDHLPGSGRLDGKRALITGGDSGIGRAVAIAFAREGADVAISYLPDEEEDARTTARWVEDAGRTAVLLPGDIRDEEFCRQLVADAVAGLGGLDVLVNNAAYQMAQDEGLRGSRPSSSTGS